MFLPIGEKVYVPKSRFLLFTIDEHIIYIFKGSLKTLLIFKKYVYIFKVYLWYMIIKNLYLS